MRSGCDLYRRAAFAEGKTVTAIIGLCTSGSFNVLGNDVRCSLIGKEIGFENVGVDAEVETSTHGNEASFEFVVEKNPEYIFVLDRDAAIAAEGAQLAQEIMENELCEHDASGITSESAVNSNKFFLKK